VRWVIIVAGVAAAAFFLTGWGIDGPGVPPPRDEERPRREPPRRESPRRESRAPSVARVRCPAGVPGCRSVRGRVVLVERVDPDGDGDLHVVVLDGGISAPGVTAVDVRPGLRPRRDPRAGDVVSAAGPVQPGSYGQRQIHALRFRAAR
jgi:hypothetical protein